MLSLSCDLQAGWSENRPSLYARQETHNAECAKCALGAAEGTSLTMPTRFDLTDLRLFMHVAEAGSITHGAARANMTLASASERIRAMEAVSYTHLTLPTILRV